MVALDAVKQFNRSLKNHGPGLVGVFVGGTSGIGASTARAFVKHAVSPRVYLIGRNETQASKLIDEFKTLNTDSQVTFLKTDVSLLRKVDEVCQTIQKREEKVNILFMTSGYFVIQGRDETDEGLDRKLSVHYYARMRFAERLLPQLTAAATQPNTPSEETPPQPLASVVSVLHPGKERPLILDDLPLKDNYSLKNCATHAVAMNTLAVGELAKANPSILFAHCFPGFVKTGVTRESGPIVRFLIAVIYFLGTPWGVSLEESGERHLYAATALKAGEGHRLDWDGEPAAKNELLDEYKEKKTGELVWAHTLDVFKTVSG